MINQVIQISCLDSHLLCPIQFLLNGMHISEIVKFLADSLSVTTHVIRLKDPFNVTIPVLIQLHLCGVTSYFDVYFTSIAEYLNEEIPKIHLLADNLWDPSTEECSECKTMVRGLVFVNTVILYSWAYDAIDVMDDDNLEAALLAQKRSA